MRARNGFIALICVLMVGITGCAGTTSSSESTVPQTTANPTQTSPSTPSLPAPPETLSNESAKAVAIAYERVVIFNALQAYYGQEQPSGGGAWVRNISAEVLTPENGTVISKEGGPKGRPRNLSARGDGIYVEVIVSYRLHSEGPCSETAIYHVTTETINHTSMYTLSDEIVIHKPLCD